MDLERGGNGSVDPARACLPLVRFEDVGVGQPPGWDYALAGQRLQLRPFPWGR